MKTTARKTLPVVVIYYMMSLLTAHAANYYWVGGSESPPCFLEVTAYVKQEVSCYGSDDGKAGAALSGGIPPYNFQWSDGQTDSVAVWLTPGTYYLTVTDSQGCAATDSITFQDIPLQEIDLGVDTVEVGYSYIFFGPPGYNWYSWNITNGTIESQGAHQAVAHFDSTGQSILTIWLYYDIDVGISCADKATLLITVAQGTGIGTSAFLDVEYYPNPASNIITLKSAAIEGSATLILYDALGSEVWQQSTASDLARGTAIDLTAFSAGIYFLHLHTASGSRVIRVVLK